jgi:hypothetical protein
LEKAVDLLVDVDDPVRNLIRREYEPGRPLQLVPAQHLSHRSIVNLVAQCPHQVGFDENRNHDGQNRTLQRETEPKPLARRRYRLKETVGMDDTMGTFAPLSTPGKAATMTGILDSPQAIRKSRLILCH